MTAKFIEAVSKGNAEVGAFFEEIGLDAANFNPQIEVEVGQDATKNVDAVKREVSTALTGDATGGPDFDVAFTPEVEDLTTADMPTVPDVTYQVNADTSPARLEMADTVVAAGELAQAAGLAYDTNFALAITQNVPLVYTAFQQGINNVLIRQMESWRRLGHIAGQNYVVGVASGVVERSRTTLPGAGRFAAFTLLAAMNNALAIRSPSKKGFAQGENYINALVLGMESVDAAAKARDIAGAMLGAVEGEFANPAAMRFGGALGPGATGVHTMAPQAGPVDRSRHVTLSLGGINVNGANRDGSEIAQEIWRELQGSLDRLSLQAV